MLIDLNFVNSILAWMYIVQFGLRTSDCKSLRINFFPYLFHCNLNHAVTVLIRAPPVSSSMLITCGPTFFLLYLPPHVYCFLLEMYCSRSYEAIQMCSLESSVCLYHLQLASTSVLAPLHSFKFSFSLYPLALACLSRLRRRTVPFCQ